MHESIDVAYGGSSRRSCTVEAWPNPEGAGLGEMTGQGGVTKIEKEAWCG
jgi:hypothetical protein